LRATLEAVAFVPKGVIGAFLPLMTPIILWALPLIGLSLVIYDPKGGFNLGVFAFYWLVSMVTRLMATGALYRLALNKKGVGPLGLQFTMVELRILAAVICMGLFFLVLMLPAIVILFTVVGDTKSVGNFHISTTYLGDIARVAAGPNGAVSLMAIGLCWLWGLFLWARLRLFLAVGVAEDRVAIGSAWGLTQGATLSMMIGTVLMTAPSLGWAFGSLYWSPDGDALTRLTGIAISDAALTFLVFTALTSILEPVLIAGFDASAYRQAVKPRYRPRPEAPAEPSPAVEAGEPATA
jgi:hypothetical protein